MYWLFRFLSLWPLRWLHAVGAGLGHIVWICSPGYRQTFRANVAQAGLAFDVAQPAIAEAGRFIGELPNLWMRPPEASCLENVTIQDQHHAEAARASGRGVIFFGCHCGGFELAMQALAELYGPLTAMYRPARKPWLARIVEASRRRRGSIVVPASLSGIRQMHKALKTRQTVGVLTDQVPPEGLGVWAPFFGKPAYTMTLAARLALQNSAVLVPVSCERLSRGQGYVLKFWPALQEMDAVPAPDLLEAVTIINRAIEAIVLSQPGQYLWAYARYKTPRQNNPGKATD